jgi:Holliday junction resolvase RusA-like endonuclease
MIDLRFELDFYITPKPRGIVGKGGNIYHSSKPYKFFRQNFINSLKNQGIVKPDEPYSKPFFVGWYYGYIDKGTDPDIDNLEGAILDSCKKYGLIKDDSRRYWRGSYKLALPSPCHYSVVYVVDFLQRQKAIDGIDSVYSQQNILSLVANL